jgi:Thiamine pyrophosphate enzyme, N-terminal TPP binding domain
MRHAFEERGQDEKLSRWGRGDPRGLSQAQDRLHYESPIWEALARQKIENRAGPIFVESWHETLAVNMAAGYTLITGRPQAVLLHAGVGML